VHHTSLADEYWAWVKNQDIEKTINFDGVLVDPCRIERPRDDPLIGPPRLTLSYPEADAPQSVRGNLPRLTAEVVKIEIIGDVGRTTVTAGRPAGLAYKVYLNGDADCAKVDPEHPEHERTFDSLAAGSTVYVVLANTRHDPGSRVPYTLEVKPTP
jgi:hypothetical protein